MIQISDLTYSIQERKILNKINLTLELQSFHSIIGLNGAGKTLLLKLISGLLKLQQGTIKNCPDEMSFVFQSATFFPWLTVCKNLEICSSLSKSEILKQLDSFKLQMYAEMYPHQLSGGTLQKVSLLRAFLNKPKLILMDEPFSQLDLIQKEELYQFTLNLWRDYKPTIILVSHDLDEAIYLSETVSYLSKKNMSIVESYNIETNTQLNFNESKLTESHKQVFSRILSRLKEDQS